MEGWLEIVIPKDFLEYERGNIECSFSSSQFYFVLNGNVIPYCYIEERVLYIQRIFFFEETYNICVTGGNKINRRYVNFLKNVLTRLHRCLPR